MDLVSPIINAWLGWRYFVARQYDLAIEQYLKTLEMDPTFVPAHLVLGQAYEQKSMPEKAIDELKKAVSLSGGSSLYVSSLAHAYAVGGRRSEADMLLKQMNEQAQHAYVPSFHIAIIYAGLRQRKRLWFGWKRVMRSAPPGWSGSKLIPASMFYDLIHDSKTCSAGSDSPDQGPSCIRRTASHTS